MVGCKYSVSDTLHSRHKCYYICVTYEIVMDMKWYLLMFSFFHRGNPLKHVRNCDWFWILVCKVCEVCGFWQKVLGANHFVRGVCAGMKSVFRMVMVRPCRNCDWFRILVCKVCEVSRFSQKVFGVSHFVRRVCAGMKSMFRVVMVRSCRNCD